MGIFPYQQDMNDCDPSFQWSVVCVKPQVYKLRVASYILKKIPRKSFGHLARRERLSWSSLHRGRVPWGPSMDDRCSIRFLSFLGDRAEWCSLCLTRCYYSASSPRAEGFLQYYTRPRDAAVSDHGEQVSPSSPPSSGRHIQNWECEVLW